MMQGMIGRILVKYLNNMSFIKYILVVALCSMSIHTLAKDYIYSPDITAFDKNTYGADRQNWDIEVDENNIIYIANNRGLLRYIYGQWVLNELPSGRFLRTICVYENKIWCGGDGIGFFDIDNSGNLSYKYLTDIDGYVWNVEAKGDHVFFQSNNDITVYNIHTESLVQFKFPRTLSGLCLWQDQLWTISADKGLGTLDSDGFSFVRSFPKGQEQEVRVLFEHDEKLYVLMLSGEIYAYDGSDFQMIDLPNQQSCFSAVHYDEHTFYLGSILEGIIPVKTENEQVSVQRSIQQHHGLLDNTVLSMAVDNDGNIWAGLDYGIARVNKESSLKSIIRKGATYDILLGNNTTYVATNKGLYANYESTDFSLISETQGQVWALNESPSGLFACHNNGLIKLNNTSAELVYDESGVMDVAQFGSSQHYIFSAYIGTIWMEYDGRGFNFKQNLGLWGNPKLSYDEENDCVWAYGGSPESKIYRIQINTGECQVTETSMRDVFETENGLFFYDGEALFEYLNGAFVQSKINLVQSIKGEGITALELSLNDNIAVCIQNEELKLIEELADGSTVVHAKLLSELNNDILKQFESIKIHEQLLYIGTEQGVKVLPLKLRNNRQALKDPIISKIEITYTDEHKSKTLYYPDTREDVQLSYHQFKTVTLSFASGKKQNIEYRFRLLPYNKEWSDWSFSQKQIAYGDLKPRDYVFELECRYNGTIERHTAVPIVLDGNEYYYLRIGLLFLAFFALSLLVLQFGKNRKLKLKYKHFKEASAEEQIQSKKEQLLQFTEIIRHKNTFLLEVRSALAQMKNSAASRWANKIDQEINQEKKDFLFHKLFAEDHQDFIQRISTEFSNLTPHDIRLISFIRINANTNEIAQFLNISTSSVDTARYRLRKKLNLEHADNLNKFVREY